MKYVFIINAIILYSIIDACACCLSNSVSIIRVILICFFCNMSVPMRILVLLRMLLICLFALGDLFIISKQINDCSVSVRVLLFY